MPEPTEEWVSIPNPDNPHDQPIYEGEASDAHTRLIDGEYKGRYETDEEVTVIVRGDESWVSDAHLLEPL